MMSFVVVILLDVLVCLENELKLEKYGVPRVDEKDQYRR